MEYPEIPDRLYSDGALVPECPFVECAALGAMIIDEPAREYGLKVLTPRLIANPFNRRVFVAIGQLQRRKAADKRIVRIGPVEVAEQMKRAGWPPGRAYLYCMGLVEFVSGTSNYRAYVDGVKDTARLRGFFALSEFIALAEHSRCATLEPDADPQHIASCITKAVSQIMREGYVDPKEIFQRTK